MKTEKIVLALIFLSISIVAQNPMKKFDFGATVVTVNSPIAGVKNLQQNKPHIEYLNAIFFRYSNERVGLRTFCSYTQYQTTSTGTSTFATLLDGWGGRLDFKDFKVGLGAQYTLFKKNDWLYTFFDMAYSNVYWSGTVLGDVPSQQNSYSATINGFVSYFGVGTKIKVLKVLSVSPEMSFSIFRGQEKNNITDLLSGQTTHDQLNLASSQPLLKLHVTYRF